MRPHSTIAWNSYPALLAAGALAAGIVAAAYGAGYVWGAVGLGAAGGVWTAGRVAGGRLVTLRALGNVAAAGLLLLAAGALRHTTGQGVPAAHLVHHLTPAGETVHLTGRLTEAPSVRPSGLRFVLGADTLRRVTSSGSAGVPVTGEVQVTLRGEEPGVLPPEAPSLRYGRRVRLTGLLRPVPAPRNPADFDYGRYLRRRGIHATLTVAPSTVASGSLTVYPTPCTGSGCLPAAARRTVRRLIDRYVPDAAARPLLAALLLGDRSGLEAQVRDRFTRTGLLHLLAVSGLHVLLVGMLLYRLLCPLLTRLGLRWKAMQRLRTVLTLAVLLGYLVLTGGSASVVRAVVMAAVWMGGVGLQRSTHALNTLGVAALVLLWWRPVQLFEPGFQLSFAAVGGLLVLMPRLRAPLPARLFGGRLRRSVSEMTLASLAATLGTLPVLLYHFGHVAFGGLLLNLAAIPLTMGVLAAGLLMLATAWTPPLAAAYGHAAAGLAQALLHTAAPGEQWLGNFGLRTYLNDGWLLGAVVLLLVALAQAPRPRHRWRLVLAAGTLVAAGVWHQAFRDRGAPRLEVLFFDVGQGDAALVTFPHGARLLIDAGPRDAYTDQAQRTLLPHLHRYGIRRLDAVAVTHPHSDHLGGLPGLLRHVPVGRVLENGRPYDSDLYRETRHLLDSLGLAAQALAAGDTIHLDPSVRIQVLAPERGDGLHDANDASLVLRIVYHDVALLFTGDAEAPSEAQLLRRFGSGVSSTVVKVGHHGSATSSTLPFVHEVLATPTRRPVAVVSVARRNRYGLPSQAVLDRWSRAGAAVWSTAEGGALWLRTDGHRVETVRWR